MRVPALALAILIVSSAASAQDLTIVDSGGLWESRQPDDEGAKAALV